MAYTFKAKADDGTIYEITDTGPERVDASHMKGRASTMGMGELFDSNGGRVTELSDGRYKINSTGEIVQRID